MEMVSWSRGDKEVDGNFNPTGFPIVNEKVELDFLYVKGASMMDLNDNKMFQELEEKTNVHINWQYVGGADWGEQKALLLAGDDLPDVFFGNNSINYNDLNMYIDSFIPLEGYIEEYAPNLQKAYGEEPDLKKLATLQDGHIYSLPSKLPMRPKGCDVWFINQKWLNNLGLDMPSTTDQLYTVLKAFKEDDPNGNGINDEIPLTGNGKDMFDWIRYINPWGLTDSLQENFLALDNGNPVFIPADERYKEAVKFFEKLYSEKIMDNEFFTQDGSMADAKLKNEEIALVGIGVAWEPKAQTNPHQDEYTVLPPVAGPDGHRSVRGHDQIITYRRNEFTVTTSCEYPEVAIRWADAFADDEISMQSYWGPFDVVLEKTEDGFYKFLPTPEGKSGDTWYWELSPRDHGPKFVSKATEEKIILPEDSGDGEKLKIDELIKDFVAEPYPVINFTTDQVDEIATLTVDIYKHVEEQWAEWIVNGGIDDEWDDYVEYLNRMGLDRLMEIYEESYENYKAQ